MKIFLLNPVALVRLVILNSVKFRKSSADRRPIEKLGSKKLDVI